jgi:uncharacterized protein (TIGR03435 family)
MLSLAGTAFGQEFEVVSVKPNQSGSNGSSMNTNQGRLTATNVSLRSLIVMAYGLKDYQVEGQDWLREERFDLAAKFPGALPFNKDYNEALGAMMRQMLLDRFKLEVHRDTKTFPVYGLVVGKSGIKFKEVPDSGSHNQNNNNNHLTATCIPMVQFADFLSRRMDLPVLDMTGLTGFYDLTLDYVPETRPGDGKGATVAAEDAAGLTLPMAIQEQLGLKMEARKAPIGIIIVDHAEKAPTEN